MNDSSKFWELANRLYTEYEKSAKKATEYKKLEEEKKYTEYKKVEEKKQEIKTSNPGIEKLKKLFIQNLDKIPADKQVTTYPRLEKNILRQLELARKRGATLLVQKLEVMITILREKMNNEDDDESVMNSIFSE